MFFSSKSYRKSRERKKIACSDIAFSFEEPRRSLDLNGSNEHIVLIVLIITVDKGWVLVG